MQLQPINLKARDIPDAWFQCIDALLSVGFDYEIQHGSYIGSKRLEFDWITVEITHPQTRPLEPDIPSHYGIPNPVEPGYIDQYLPYLMTDHIEPGEDYTYGSRLVAGEHFDVPDETQVDKDCQGEQWSRTVVNQIECYIKLLRDTPNTNQAILQVGQPGDCLLNDPPCLRHIDMRVKEGQLIFYPYFRSWDLWGGFPANLGGIVHLQEYMAGEIGVDPGPFVCASKGLHLYNYVWELAEARRGKKIHES